MKVYIVTKDTTYNRTQIIAVYSNKKAATDKLMELNPDGNYDYEIVEEYVND